MTQDGDLLTGYWDAVRARLKGILLVSAAAALVSFGISQALPKIYSARASIYALESPNALASALGQAPFAVLGLPAPSQPSDYLVAVLESDTVMAQVAARCHLSSNPRFGARKHLTRDEVLDALRKRTRIRAQGNQVAVIVETGDPRLSAEVANEYLRQLDRSIYRFSQRKREFVESQLTEQKAALRRAQQELQTFQSRHRAVALDAQAAEAVKTAADLEAQRIQNRIALQQNATALKTMGSVDDLLRLRVEKEMLETKGQDLAQALAEQEARLVDMPTTMTELSRLTWEVGARQSVVEMLQRNYESARIGERDEEARYQVLDVAMAPEKPVRPRALLNAFLAGMLGLMVGIAWAFVRGPER